MNYQEFIKQKSQISGNFGFEPIYLPDFLYDFQKHLVEWGLKKGTCAVFADCGLGKTPMQLVWADNVRQKTNKPVLILTPLSVSYQTVQEAAKFGIEAKKFEGQIKDGDGIIVTNYEQLEKVDSTKIGGVVCDESSILKNFDGTLRAQITQFMRKIPYRSLWTATAAPNDYTELGTSSEALGRLGYMDMLNKFFKNNQNNSSTKKFHGKQPQWRFKGHAEIPFWKWVASWAKAVRKPSDLGFSDEGFNLPGLQEKTHLIENTTPLNGMLFSLPARDLHEQRQERRKTIKERCEKVAELVNTNEPAIVWCNLNDEADQLAKLIPDGAEVSGRDSDARKEEKLIGFKNNEFRVLITKPKIAAWGLNYQHCRHMTYFPTHSYEAYYQASRRLLRFGQQNKVKVDFITTHGDKPIIDNLKEKSEQADEMFERLIQYMNDAQSVESNNTFQNQQKLPSWL